jgi:succinyl-diaminopimelate desuccinylase
LEVHFSHEIIQYGHSLPSSPDTDLVKSLSAAVAEVYARQTRCVGIGGGTVAAFLRNAGIEAAVWCRITECAHQPNEFALLSNILGDAKVMASLALSIGGNND